MLDEESAFLRTICEHPGDDVPRLVFADWLQENGGEDRAEYIRVQIELTRLPEGDSRPPALRGRQYELENLHREEWVRPLPEWARKRAVFERGFVSVVEGRANDWLRDGPAILELTPLRGVSLLRARSSLAELLADPTLPRLRMLDLRFNHLGDAGVAELSDSSHLQHLDTLYLWDNHIGDAGTRSLARSPMLAGLKTLSLGNNDITRHGAEELASSPHLAGLEQLVLFENRIDEAGRRLLRERFGGRVQLERDLDDD